MKQDYTLMGTKEFDRILREIMKEMSPAVLLRFPGVYEILAWRLKNRILQRWEDEQG